MDQIMEAQSHEYVHWINSLLKVRELRRELNIQQRALSQQWKSLSPETRTGICITHSSNKRGWDTFSEPSNDVAEQASADVVDRRSSHEKEEDRRTSHDARYFAALKAPAAAQPTYDDDDFHEFSDPAAADEQIAALIAAAEPQAATPQAAEAAAEPQAATPQAAEAAAEAAVEAIVARVEAIVAHSDAAAQA
jgi:hypothetical protein